MLTGNERSSHCLLPSALLSSPPPPLSLEAPGGSAEGLPTARSWIPPLSSGHSLGGRYYQSSRLRSTSRARLLSRFLDTNSSTHRLSTLFHQSLDTIHGLPLTTKASPHPPPSRLLDTNLASRVRLLPALHVRLLVLLLYLLVRLPRAVLSQPSQPPAFYLPPGHLLPSASPEPSSPSLRSSESSALNLLPTTRAPASSPAFHRLPGLLASSLPFGLRAVLSRLLVASRPPNRPLPPPPRPPPASQLTPPSIGRLFVASHLPPPPSPQPPADPLPSSRPALSTQAQAHHYLL